jgi:hypothetical protein
LTAVLIKWPKLRMELDPEIAQIATVSLEAVNGAVGTPVDQKLRAHMILYRDACLLKPTATTVGR